MHSILSGFQLASQAGPLCEEPVVYVVFIKELFNPACCSLCQKMFHDYNDCVETGRCISFQRRGVCDLRAFRRL